MKRILQVKLVSLTKPKPTHTSASSDIILDHFFGATERFLIAASPDGWIQERQLK
jgi:hypothetical protein